MNIRPRMSWLIAGLMATISLSASGYAPPTHRYYRFVIDSVSSSTDGLSSVNELQLKIGGQWLVNSNGTVGNNKHGLVRFGPAVGTSYEATVDLTDECCSRDLGLLFDGLDNVSWVAGYPTPFFGGATGDSLAPDSVSATFDFGASPIALEGMRIFGDPYFAGTEAPDRFKIQYSENGVDFFTVYKTDHDVGTFSGTGYEALMPLPHRYYRFLIDSVGSNTDGLSSVNELQLKIGGDWLVNSNGTIGASTHGLVRFGPLAGTSYQATVDLTDECCGRDLSQLFDGINAVAWVAGYPYHAFATGATGDSIVADSIWAKFDFGSTPIALEAMRVFGDPWDNNGGAPGAEAPDRFRIQYSNDGINYVKAFQTGQDAATFGDTGFIAVLDVLFSNGFE